MSFNVPCMGQIFPSKTSTVGVHVGLIIGNQAINIPRLIDTMRVLILLLVLAYVVAFAPMSSRPTTTSLMMSEKSRSMPFLNKPKNLEGLVVSITFHVIVWNEKTYRIWTSCEEMPLHGHHSKILSPRFNGFSSYYEIIVFDLLRSTTLSIPLLTCLYLHRWVSTSNKILSPSLGHFLPIHNRLIVILHGLVFNHLTW